MLHLVAVTQIEAWHQRRVGAVEFGLRGAQVFDGGVDFRTLVVGQVQGRVTHVGNHAGRYRGYRQVVGRHFAHNALEAGGYVVQVGQLGQQVGFRQCDTGCGLLLVHALADTAAGTLGDLVVHLAVDDVVFLGIFHQLLETHGIKVGLCGLQGRFLGSALQLVVLRQPVEAQRLDRVAGVETVKQHLRHAEPDRVAGVVAEVEQRRLPLFPSDIRIQVNAGEVPALRCPASLAGRHEVIPGGVYLRAVNHGLLDGLVKTRNLCLCPE